MTLAHIYPALDSPVASKGSLSLHEKSPAGPEVRHTPRHVECRVVGDTYRGFVFQNATMTNI